MKEQKKERPIEQEAVKTTIVGGRPPGSGKPVGKIPRGIEVLVKKASIDSAFKTLLLEKRADAAKEIELALEPSEVMMLNAVPREQLESIITKTTIRPSQRAAFMGKVAALMIVALTATSGCKKVSEGIRPDRPEYENENYQPEETEGVRPDRPEYKEETEEKEPENIPAPTGIRPDIPEVNKEEEIAPEPPEDEKKEYPDHLTKGIRPDRPREK
mgnify:CR=1 FL=1